MLTLDALENPPRITLRFTDGVVHTIVEKQN
jgi:hypothetical protein